MQNAFSCTPRKEEPVEELKHHHARITLSQLTRQRWASSASRSSCVYGFFSTHHIWVCYSVTGMRVRCLCVLHVGVYTPLVVLQYLRESIELTCHLFLLAAISAKRRQRRSSPFRQDLRCGRSDGSCAITRSSRTHQRQSAFRMAPFVVRTSR
jgi:hypothetical protein